MITIHWGFNYAKRSHRLLFQWIQLSGELQTGEDENDMAGLSNEENTAFWLLERRLNLLWYRTINVVLLIFSIIFSAQLFFVSFLDVDIVTYAFFQAVNIVHLCWYMFIACHVMFSLNIFLLTLIWFFRNKFRDITGRIKRLQTRKRSRAHNQKLARLIYEYNVVHLELFAMRELFRNYIGFNFCHLFALSLLAAFASLFVDLRTAIVLLLIMIIVTLTATFPFFFANAIIVEVNCLTSTCQVPLKLNHKLLIHKLVTNNKSYFVERSCEEPAAKYGV